MNKQLLKVAFVAIAITSCTARGCQSTQRSFSFTERNYSIEMWSGDSCVFRDRFHGIINQEEHSDGLFYYKGDTLIEIGGNYVIKSEK
jgi:hypothetical protein